MSDRVIRLGRVLTGSRANGPGTRDVFWTTGCSIRCPGCINPHFLEAGAGINVGLGAIEDLLRKRCSDIEGITFSGGEPTDQSDAVTEIAGFAHQLGLSVVIFTGRALHECRHHPQWCAVLEHCDVLIAGPFEQEHRRRTQPLLGSANQQVHFLTSRYCEQDLQQTPNLELVIRGNVISISGVYLPDSL
jgi:anaerobic ribonucleoside-triphosphate reductase activating protein